MTGERRQTYSHLYFIVLIIVFAIFSILLLHREVQDSYRKQARYNLEQIKYCYTSIVENYGVKKASQICTAKSKTGFTGDVYVLDADTKEFVYENSNDTSKDSLTFTKDSVGVYFNDWESGDRVIKTILLGKDSEEDTKAFYLFDNSIEWLEWKYLPDDVKNDNDLKLIAVQGVQSDEAYANFKAIEYMILVVSSVGVLVLVFLHRLQFSRVHQRRRSYDKPRPESI